MKDTVLEFPFSYTGENWELLVSITFCLDFHWLNRDNNQPPWLLIKFDISLESCYNPLNGTAWEEINCVMKITQLFGYASVVWSTCLILSAK